MSAQLEEPAIPAIDGFDFVPLKFSDPAIRDLFVAFVRRYGLPPNTKPIGKEWYGLVKDGKVRLVTGIARREDRSVEITDFYVEPSRLGFQAGLVAGEFFKAFVDSGKIDYIVGTVLWRNRFMQRHFEKMFGEQPRCVVFCYNGGANGSRV
jgi:hypothetical protein